MNVSRSRVDVNRKHDLIYNKLPLAYGSILGQNVGTRAVAHGQEF